MLEISRRTICLAPLFVMLALPAEIRSETRGCRELAVEPAFAAESAQPLFSSRNPAETLDEMTEVGAVELATRIRPGESFSATLAIDGAAMTLTMKPESVRAAGFACDVLGTDGPARSTDPGPVPTFRGSIREIPGSVAVGAVIGNEVVLMIWLPEGGTLWANLTQGLSSARGLAYVADGLGAEIADEASSALFASAAEASLPLAGGGVADCALQGFCLAEIVIDTDSGFYSAYSGTPQEIEDQIQATVQAYVAMVNVVFEQEFDITHRISRCVIRPDPSTDPYSPPGSTGGDMLARIAIEWFNLPPGDPPRDVVHLLTNASWLPGTVGGAAYVDGVCSSVFIGGMQGFTRDSGGLPSCTRAAVLMHELGHTWGAPHNNPPCAGLMDEGGAACGRDFCPPTCGSPCSRDEIEQRRDEVDQGCLGLVFPLFRDGFESGDVGAWSCVAPAMVCPD